MLTYVSIKCGLGTKYTIKDMNDMYSTFTGIFIIKDIVTFS